MIGKIRNLNNSSGGGGSKLDLFDITLWTSSYPTLYLIDIQDVSGTGAGDNRLILGRKLWKSASPTNGTITSEYFKLKTTSTINIMGNYYCDHGSDTWLRCYLQNKSGTNVATLLSGSFQSTTPVVNVTKSGVEEGEYRLVWTFNQGESRASYAYLTQCKIDF